MNGGDLPPGWECVYCPDIDRCYFVDHNTQTTTWVDPRSNYKSEQFAPNYRPPVYSYRRDFSEPVPHYSTLPSRPYCSYPNERFIRDEFMQPHHPAYGSPPFYPDPAFHTMSSWGPSSHQSVPPRIDNFGPAPKAQTIPVQVIKHPVTRSPVPGRSDPLANVNPNPPNTTKAQVDLPHRRPLPQQMKDFPAETVGPSEYNDGGCCSIPISRDSKPPDGQLAPEDGSPKLIQSTEPIPLPYHPLHDSPPQETEYDRESSATADSGAATHSEQPQPPQTPMELIDKSMKELDDIKPLVDAFDSATKDKQYLFLEDRLDKLILSIDQIDSAGDERVRQKRRQATKDVLSVISMLEQKLTLKDISSDVVPVPDAVDSPLEESNPANDAESTPSPTPPLS